MTVLLILNGSRKRVIQGALRFIHLSLSGQSPTLALVSHVRETTVRVFPTPLNCTLEKRKSLAISPNLIETVPEHFQSANLTTEVAARNRRQKRIADHR